MVFALPLGILVAIGGNNADRAMFPLYLGIAFTGAVWIAFRAVMLAIFDGAEDIAAIRAALEK